MPSYNLCQDYPNRVGSGNVIIRSELHEWEGRQAAGGSNPGGAVAVMKFANIHHI